MSKDLIECCSRKYLVKRYSIKPFYPDIIKEEFTRLDECANCHKIIIEVFRTRKKADGTQKKMPKIRLSGYGALNYLCELNKRDITPKRIFNYRVEKGSKSAANFFYGHKNKRKNLNDKSYGKVIMGDKLKLAG